MRTLRFLALGSVLLTACGPLPYFGTQGGAEHHVDVNCRPVETEIGLDELTPLGLTVNEVYTLFDSVTWVWARWDDGATSVVRLAVRPSEVRSEAWVASVSDPTGEGDVCPGTPMIWVPVVAEARSDDGVIDLVTESVAAVAVERQGLTLSVWTAAEVDLGLCGEPLAHTQFSLAFMGSAHGYVLCGNDSAVLSW